MPAEVSHHVKPLTFVAMPFGRKQDPTERVEIDFDDVYARAIAPAAEIAGVDVIRADEERSGGLIHVAMYERLLLAEIVIADVTLSSPNVLYELGIRHAARPRSTVLLFAKVSQLPFDIAPMRAIPYELEEGRLTDEQAHALSRALVDRLRTASEADEEHDSPIFQLIAGYPGITLSHEATESFRKRVRMVAELTERIRALTRRSDRAAALDELQALAREISPATSPRDVVVELLLAYRDLEAWSEEIALIERLPHELRQGVTVRQQLAMALSRRNGPGDREEAIAVLERLLREDGESPETYGILGRVYKAQWRDARDSDPLVADAALQAAIDAYVAGFTTDPRSFYPGVNALSLLVAQGTPEALERVQELLPMVSFAVGRRGGVASTDYWLVATALELAVIAEDEKQAVRAAGRARLVRSQPWMRATTADNLEDLARHMTEAGRDVGWIQPLAGALRD
jgi:tetratricopeptide (TPR) repeat protein